MRVPNQPQRDIRCPLLRLPVLMSIDHLGGTCAQLQNRLADRDVHDMQLCSLCDTAVHAADEMIKRDWVALLPLSTGNRIRPHENISTMRLLFFVQNNGAKLDNVKLVPVPAARGINVWQLRSVAAAGIGHTTRHTFMDCGSMSVWRLKTKK